RSLMARRSRRSPPPRSAPPEMPLDALVTGRVATFAGESGFGWAEAIGIRDGKVAFAGSAVDLETRADPHTLRVEIEPGEIAIPGLTDAHLHVIDAALAMSQVDLSTAATLEEGLERIAAGAPRVPDPANRAFDMYIGLAEDGDLPIRVHVGVRAEGLDDAIKRGFRSGDLLGGRDARRDGRLTMGWLKLFADGTLASRTAALLEPV